MYCVDNNGNPVDAYNHAMDENPVTLIITSIKTMLYKAVSQCWKKLKREGEKTGCRKTGAENRLVKRIQKISSRLEAYLLSTNFTISDFYLEVFVQRILQPLAQDTGSYH